ncbi:MAG: MarR family transcriptional regulator [Firmicutes bacterium]|uniref:DNA-binding transcriptional regulator, MarR family n=1 Tax=Melghirimyces thermohalophilus TaxID=1236220 RepID=A0A1G6K9K8_9BACL|nr:MarR family transcriptional regulator [Melghirimyces thermohalophilus]MDA8354105.1 MarR family transcriptional regulator [Bacillota bacterium]SDC27749.1 DNA-binding transcriptional regulator, MarR family [Melghirimyces thermohalophilus]
MKDELLDELEILMRRNARAFRQRLFQELKEYNLTVPQNSVLRTLSLEGRHSLAKLSESVGMTTSSVSGIIDRLEKQGWVQRTRDKEDRRVVWIDLTDDGRKRMLEVPVLRPDHFKNMLRKCLSEEDVELLVIQLRKLHQGLEKELTKGGDR